MTTFQNKTIVVIGGSSGIGFAVALASLQSFASIVIIASSNQTRVNDAVERLRMHQLPGEVRGDVLDGKDSAAVKLFAEKLGAVDHIVWTSGDLPEGVYTSADTVEQGQEMFSVRFWGPFIVAKYAKFHPGGSLTLTSGVGGLKPHPGIGWVSSVPAALDGLVRGLAVDLAPVRVNVVNPGAIDTELFDKRFGDKKEEIFKAFTQKILLKRVGEASEIAEAYLFLMRCGYITGQRIDVEGGWLLL
ncbi:hypothetical protein CVT25_014344 [Psilocybe cyanescens]|uniref:Uncharacterized protein n=1 Tax=Psilocybe cyanescens TaxID=93625 RepID=A0A409WUA2_PSICY|nr:hypothetical protein CVT25_014344 [Psilocybe cyanescens]